MEVLLEVGKFLSFSLASATAYDGPVCTTHHPHRLARPASAVAAEVEHV